MWDHTTHIKSTNSTIQAVVIRVNREATWALKFSANSTNICSAISFDETKLIKSHLLQESESGSRGPVGYLQLGLNPHMFSYTLGNMASHRHSLHLKRESFRGFLIVHPHLRLFDVRSPKVVNFFHWPMA